MLMSGFLYSWKRSVAASQYAQESQGTSENFPDLRFSVDPMRGESGFSQWKTAMKMVVQLPDGIPPDFRRKLWINLSEKYLTSRNVDWQEVEAKCFSEWAHPADAELDVQIVKDLHRTGCSLFCGESGQEKQAVLKKVLLAYARWNKRVGYCQGFNMLAALILQVTEGCETDALKIMIFLIEGVLPESYFADSLRGLSVDMVVFRELLKGKLPGLSNHLDKLQFATKDGSVSYEPPLTNVFTMQWFLTIFCNCLPHTTVLRVWDLIFLEGNDVLLRTALAIWQLLEEKIMTVRNADEFYCIMGVLTREMLEVGLVNANLLVKLIVNMGPLKELQSLREKYLYNINPWGPGSTAAIEVNRQLKLYRKENLRLDISALKKQYIKLKHRQRQAHIIFTAAINKQPPPNAPPMAINHLLVGKSAIIPSKRLGPPKGSVPPLRSVASLESKTSATLHWKDAERRKYSFSSSSSSSSDTELCDDPGELESDSISEDEGKDETPSDNRVSTSDMDESRCAVGSDNTFLDESVVISNNGDNGNPCDYNTGIAEISDGKRAICDQLLRSISNDTAIAIRETPNPENFEVCKGVGSPSDSELDDSDFEKFLENRVKKLNIAPIVDENGSTEDTNTSRTDSSKESRQRALEIIQENSVILHRILQCQPTLSSSFHSPQQDFKTDFSSLENQIDTKFDEINLEEDSSKSGCDATHLSALTTFSFKDKIGYQNEEGGPIEERPNCVESCNLGDEKSLSVSTEHLGNGFDRSQTPPLSVTAKEISVSMDGRSVFHNSAFASPPSQFDSKSDSFTVRDFDVPFTKVALTSPLNGSTFEYTKSEGQQFNSKEEEFSKRLDKKYEELVLKPRRPGSLQVNSFNDGYKYKRTEKTEKSSKLETPNSKFEANAVSFDKRSPNKSPTSDRIYDPFPVHISSRQNRDVGVRLGIYKK